jgi:hypothetical protein
MELAMVPTGSSIALAFTMGKLMSRFQAIEWT